MDNQRSADQQNRIENADEELQRGAQVRIRDSGLEFDLAGAGDPDGSSDEVSRKKEESSDRSRAEAYTYGDTLPLTHKMATEIARRFVTGKKIPKRLEWR